jgi:ribonuclease R
MQEIFRKNIVKHLQDDQYTPVKLSRLARDLGVDDEDYAEFKAAFDELRGAGHVIIGQRNLIDLQPMSSQVVGTFRANPKGFGFVVPLEPNAHGDLFIPPDQVSDAMTGDIVIAKVVKKGKRLGQMRVSGQIITVQERAQHQFVGTLVRQEGHWLVQPDGSAFIEPISVEDVTAKNARENDKVVVEILSYPSDRFLARGVIMEVLGKAGRYDTEIRSVIHQYHLAEAFDQDCIDQARAAAEQFDPAQGRDREDISAQVTVTIDPADAKDFDDAISLERDKNGHWVLGVHIADVSHFIAPDSPLDVEAQSRGNSVYLPGRTIPMLPEILSNGICSLQPDQRRFAKSAYISYDDQGKVLSTRFANSIICSTQRLTYLQANAILHGHTKDFPPEVIQLVKQMESLSRIIEQRRVAQGMLHLDMPETDLVMDDAGRVVDAHPADDSYPHTMIEMFMVEANVAVATMLDRRKIPFLRRIHPDPSPMSMKQLARLLKTFGFTLPRSSDRHTLQDLLKTVAGTDMALAVNIAVLRSFEKAVYAPLHIGHYALASTHYCHFTSPIRRYADLMVHRMLQFVLDKRLDQALQIGAALDLAGIGRHISFTDRCAEDAERELKTVLILQMLSEHVGDELDCVVTGLTGFGAFVQCRKYGIEGLIRTPDLGADQWKFNERTQCIMGERSGICLRLGQGLHVRIISVNVPARQLNLAPCEALVQEKTRARSKPTGKRGKGRTRKRQSGKKRR